ncbi:hypothetical protein KP509_38G053200 [Ceratopteris richardii]|nr:hypothetical protein KP509_38G053200 [Ceratopteris richardii]
MERFVRFVSTPEILEQATAVEMELAEIEKAMHMQSGDAFGRPQHDEELLSKPSQSVKLTGGAPLIPEHTDKLSKDFLEPAGRVEELSKQQLSSALEARRLLLLKQMQVVFARASAAGFNPEHIGDLIQFAETFGAKRLSKACSDFLSLCKKRQVAGLEQEDKLFSTEILQTEMNFSSGMAHHVGYKGLPESQIRGLNQEDIRWTSLPTEGRLLSGEGGPEKLTRRGSLDELTGEFLQVAARMRQSGTIEGINVDRPSNRQWGSTRQISGEMKSAVPHLDMNSNFRDVESARGQQQMGAWNGQFIHNVHLHGHGPMHSALPAPFGFPGFSPPGVAYPPYPSDQYMGHAYSEVNGWKFPPYPHPSMWPRPAFSNTNVPNANEQGGIGTLSSSQKIEGISKTSDNTESHTESSSSQQSLGDISAVNNPRGEFPVSICTEVNEKSGVSEHNGEQSTSAHIMANDESTVSESNEGPIISDESSIKDSFDCNDQLLPSSEGPLNDSSTLNEQDGEVPASTRNPVIDSSNKGDTQDLSVIEVSISGTEKSGQENESTSDSFHDGDGESITERTRRLPVRSSSPSRRSASPLRKVHVGRSGSRRSGPVAIRSVNYISHSTQEHRERGNNDDDSSGSWSEDNDEKIDDKVEEKPVRARVQEVIGLFEKKKNGEDPKEKLLRKESVRLQPKNSVLKRWTESNAIKEQTSEAESTVKRDQSVSRAAVSSGINASETCHDQPNVLGRLEETHLIQEEPVVASNISSCLVEFPSDERAVAKDLICSGNIEKDVCNDQKLDSNGHESFDQRNENQDSDVRLLDVGKENASEPCNVAVSNDAQILSDTVDDMHPDHEKDDEGNAFNNGQEDKDQGSVSNSEAVNSMKISARDAKVKTMQEMLERRKAASGNRPGKSNPLAEAQLRAEKLRAYKAGLQKSKQEKDEEEKKRIEELKSQRKERIAARTSPAGGSSTQSTATRSSLRTPPPLIVSKSSPSTSQKTSSKSQQSSTNNVSVSSCVSPTIRKSKASSGNKLPRTPTGTPKANENTLCRSVPSLSDLKRESPKSTVAVRSSTGSQLLSQMKKNSKDNDLSLSPKFNGHNEERRRSMPPGTVRKGIPPPKETKVEGSSITRRPVKASITLTKQKQKNDNSSNGKPKKSIGYGAEVASTLEQGNTEDGVVLEVSLEAGNSDTDIHHEHETKITESSVENSCSLQECGIAEDDKCYAQIRAPASVEAENLDSVQESCIVGVDESKLNVSNEHSNIEVKNSEEAAFAVLDSHTDSIVFSDRELEEAERLKNAENSYCAPIARVSSTGAENLASYGEHNANANESNLFDSKSPSSPPSEQPKPSLASTESPIHTPRNLPRLHEAIQQAHSPEFVPVVGRSKQAGADELGSQKTPKDHAKGFKRLLLLGRKSGRSTAQSASDLVSVSTTVEVSDGEGISSVNARQLKSGATASNSDAYCDPSDKPKSTSNHASSSNKGSRSFFSLPAFRGKGEGKL